MTILAAALAAITFSTAFSALAAQTGAASWYALDGRMTANGERMNSARMTAAHRHLPFGTKVRVTNLRNGKSIVVRINDRGPFAKRRILDVSKAAARKLGFLGRGHTRVRIAAVSPKTALGVQPHWPQLAKLARVALPKERPAILIASLEDFRKTVR